MKILRTAALTGLGLLSLAATSQLAAAAVAGFATTTVNERAGPGTEYPIVNQVPAGAPVTIYGCLDGWSWCDVDYAGWRGWIFGSYLQAYYQSAPVAIPYYGPTLGIPFISFSVNYWDSYYRGRPWYGQRDAYFRIPGRPGKFKPQGEGAYTYYPPGEGPYVAPGEGWGPAYGPGPRYGLRPAPGWRQPRPGRPVYEAGDDSYVFKPAPGPGRKNCPMRNGRPFCGTIGY